MAPKRHGLFCRLRSGVRRLARRNGDRSASHDSAPLPSDNARHGPYLDINIHDFDDSDSTAFSSSTSSSTTVRARAEAAITLRTSDQYSVDPRNPDLRQIRSRLDFARDAGPSRPRSSMPAGRDVSPSTHDAASPSLAPVTEEAARQASSRTQRPLPAVPRIDNATPPPVPFSNAGPSSAAPMPAQAQPATAANIGSDSGSAPPRPPRNPERSRSVASRGAGEPLQAVAPNTGEGSAQANPEPKPPSPTPTRIEYPASPPFVTASPSPEASESASAAPQPAIFDVLQLLSYIADTLFTISGQLDANHNILVERINVTSGHSYRILGDIVQATQRRDGRSATLSSSYEAPSGASGALPPEPPEVVSGIPARRAETPQPELTADPEQSPYVPTELDTPLDDVPASLSIEIVEADNELLPVDLGGGGDAHAAEAATVPAQALNATNGPLDESEARESATEAHEDAITPADADGALPQSDPTSSVDVGQADGQPRPTAPSQAPPPASDAASLSGSESEAADTQSQAVLNEDSCDTLVICRPTSELLPGTLQLVIDVGTDSQVQNGDKVLFLGDLDGAVGRLPGICAEREVEWSQLYLRIRKPVYKSQDSMLRIMRCLGPYLRYFLAVRLVMDDKRDVEDLYEGAFTGDFSRLLSLSVEGQCSQHRILLFPLANLRCLIIKAHLSNYAMLDILNRAESLQTLQLEITQSKRGQDGQVRAPEAPLRGIRFPSVVFITADDPSRALPYLRAAETTTEDLRLKVNHGLRSLVLKEIFDRHDNWVISAK